MKNNSNSLTRRVFLAGVSTLLLSGSVAPVLSPALAHEADCPVCSLPVVQDTADLDNEVKLRYGRKRIEYRCVYCALTEAQNDFKDGDVAIAAPSETKGKPVVLKREAGKWSATPATAVFVAEKVKHKHCQVGYRALTSRAAFEAYAKKNKAVIGDAKPISLAQMLEVSK
jgi:hypothetical protein